MYYYYALFQIRMTIFFALAELCELCIHDSLYIVQL